MICRFVLTIACAVLAALAWAGQVSTHADRQLKYMVVISRHGVRSPTWTPERLNRYSAEPWTAFGVPPGHLTAHGRTLMKLFGGYYRAYMAAERLLQPAGCADARRVYVWADTDQRTRETGKALAEGLELECGVETHSLHDDEPDPLFDPLAAGIAKADRNLALAAVMGRIGDHPQALDGVYGPAFQELQRILGRPRGAGPDPWHEPSAVVAGSGKSLVDVTGPLRTASTLAENLLLEYTNGVNKAGWGRLNESNLQKILVLHTAYADLVRRTRYLAQARGSNLLSHVLSSLDQAVAGKPVRGALGKPGDIALLIAGHDTNLSNLSGMLDLNWVLPGYQPNDPVPGGALVFELRRGAGESAYRVRAYYTAQSLSQMKNATPLTVEAPPLRAPLFIPGCGTPDTGYDCDWTEFRRIAAGAIVPAFVQR
jgi:4-phytase/acid phosphatase